MLAAIARMRRLSLECSTIEGGTRVSGARFNGKICNGECAALQYRDGSLSSTYTGGTLKSNPDVRGVRNCLSPPGLKRNEDEEEEAAGRKIEKPEFRFAISRQMPCACFVVQERKRGELITDSVIVMHRWDNFITTVSRFCRALLFWTVSASALTRSSAFAETLG